MDENYLYFLRAGLHVHMSVETSQGFLTGHLFMSEENKAAIAFCRIPYAHIPVGRRRFAPPETFNNWDDENVLIEVLADEELHMSENCLRMDIYSPEVQKLNKGEEFDRPVIVFVPGDVLQSLPQTYFPLYLLREDVVVVVVWYRVGILGFVKFKDPLANAPGNVGLMDLKAAFTWIRKEIKNFGGCSNNITAYGHGLGARHIRRLLTSSIFDNCFDKAILSSSVEHKIFLPPLHEHENYAGPILAEAISDRRATTTVLAEGPRDDLACVNFLRDVKIKDLYDFDNLIIMREMRERMTEEQLPHIHDELYRVKIPIIIGYNSLECLFDPHADTMNTLNVSELVGTKHDYLWDFLSTHGGAIVPEELTTLTELAQCFLRRPNVYDLFVTHPPPPEITTADERRLFGLIITTKAKYVLGTMHIARNLACEMSPENVFLYRFDVTEGAPHGLELFSLFKGVDDQTAEMRDMSNVMTKLWAQFARTGNPNLTEPPDLVQSVWQPIQGRLSHCFNISYTGLSYIEIPEVVE